MEAIEEAGWFLPSLLTILFLTFCLAYSAFKKRTYGTLVFSGMFQTISSPIFTDTFIGPLLLGLGLLQFYIGIVHIKRVKTMRHH